MEHHALQPDYMLQEYRIEKLIGEGGFGLTYLAFDTHLDKKVAIKEYMPNDFAWRQNSTTIVPKNDESKDMYQWGLDAFMNEAKILAKFDVTNIVRVYRFFKDNGTAYLVMEYCEGGCLNDLVSVDTAEKTAKTDDTVVIMRESKVRHIVSSIMQGLQTVHDSGVLHRDIKPHNIMFRQDRTPVLIDFGAARQALGEKSRSLTSIVTPGYAPLEQYSSKAKLGPWTDIYALSAVAYICLTGKKPDEATDRIIDDDIEVLAHRNRDSGFLACIDWGLAVKTTERPQTLASWKEGWDKPPVVPPPIAQPPVERPPVESVPVPPTVIPPTVDQSLSPPPVKPSFVKWIALPLALMGLSGLVYLALKDEQVPPAPVVQVQPQLEDLSSQPSEQTAVDIADQPVADEPVEGLLVKTAAEDLAPVVNNDSDAVEGNPLADNAVETSKEQQAEAIAEAGLKPEQDKVIASLTDKNQQPPQKLPEKIRSDAYIPSVPEREDIIEQGIKMSVSSINLVEVLGVADSGRFIEEVNSDPVIKKMLLNAVGDKNGRMTIEQLQKLSRDIGQYFYRKKDYLLAAVYLPVQQIRDGVVKMALLKGKLGSVVVEDYRGSSVSIFDKLLGIDKNNVELFISAFSKLHGKDVKKRKITETLFELQNTLGFVVTGEFSPDDKLGYTKLTLRAHEDKTVSRNEADSEVVDDGSELVDTENSKEWGERMGISTPDPSIALPEDQQEEDEFADDEEDL
ncbi:MAG: serine/threonine protein kinase [Phenylobacterium sp.]|jgi:serine/threonine protein kinase